MNGSLALSKRGVESGPTFSISYTDLQRHFDQPLATVARKFGVCTTFFKKVCRFYGIKRWPFRKLKSLEKKISAIEGRSVPKSSQLHQTLLELNRKIEQIRQRARPDSDSDSDSEDTGEDAGAMVAAQSSPKSKGGSPTSGKGVGGVDTPEVVRMREKAVTVFLGDILRKNIFSNSPLGLVDRSSKFDAIRGAVVFTFDVTPDGVSKIIYMS